MKNKVAIVKSRSGSKHSGPLGINIFCGSSNSETALLQIGRVLECGRFFRLAHEQFLYGIEQ